jgi:hypothetical protein
VDDAVRMVTKLVTAGPAENVNPKPTEG